MNFRPLKVFAGQSNPELAKEICEYLGVPLGHSETARFSNDNLQVRFSESLRESDVFLVQSLTDPVSDSLMELFLMLDAAKSASARRVTAVVPYFSYARSDKKDEPRISIAARLVANLIRTAGADRFLSMTLHSPQVHGFFEIPVDHLSSEVVLANHFITKLDHIENAVVLAPDAGDIKRASSMARRLDSGLAFIDKHRLSDTRVEARGLIGDVKDRLVLIVDDEISTAGSLLEAVKAAKAAGALDVYVAVTHGVYVGPALDRIRELDVKEVVCTNTAFVSEAKVAASGGKLKVLSVAPLFAEAIHRIHTGESVSSMFT